MPEDYKLRDDVKSWVDWLEEFERDVLPVFREYGYTRDAAIIAFTMQAIVINTAPDDDDECEGD